MPGIVALALLIGPAGAAAAEFEVLATASDTFNPKELTVAVGDTVRWRNTGGRFHNVRSDDGSYDMPAAPLPTDWQVSKTFTAAGEFRYYCEAHGAPGGVGMAGKVVVQESGREPPPDTQAPTVTQLVARRAARRAVRIRFASSEAGKARITLARRSGRRYRTVRTVDRRVSAGRTRLSIRRDRRGRRLRAGRYRVTVRVRDGAGNLSRARRAGVTLT